MIKHPNQPNTWNQNKINVPSTPPHLDIALERNLKYKKRKENHTHKVYGHNKKPFTTEQIQWGEKWNIRKVEAIFFFL